MAVMLDIAVAGLDSARADDARDYCRQARRLRNAYGTQPALLLKSLKSLSLERDRQTGIESPCDLPPQLRHGPAGAFAARVGEALEGGILRYSARAELLNAAESAGIPRFEANLIIALVQNRHRPSTPAVEERPPASSKLTPLLAFLAVQSAIAAGLWWALFR